MFFHYNMSWMFLFIYHCCEAADCQHRVLTHKPAHRCDVSDENTLGIKLTELHICKLECIYRLNCQFLSYSTVEGKCLIGQLACSLVPDDQSYVAFIRRNVELCLRWVPSSENASGSLVCNDGKCSHGYVGRLLTNSHLMPGWISRGSFLTVENGMVNVHLVAESKEVLYVMDGCEVAWVPFSAGDILPDNAVAGGYLSYGYRLPLYAIRGDISSGNDYRLGFYDFSARVGRVIDVRDGQFTLTQMEMLVLI